MRSGNVYIADTGNNALKKWTAATGAVSVPASSLTNLNGVAVDAQEDVYLTVSTTTPAYELARGWVDPSTRIEGPSAGSDSLPPVLPLNESLLYPFEPTYTQPLTNISVNNNVVSFSFPANNTGALLINTITLLGQAVPILQDPFVAPFPIYAQRAPGGGFQLQFTNNQGATFTVLTTTNLALPLNQWSVAGAATNIGGGLYQFAAPIPENNPQAYYVARSP